MGGGAIKKEKRKWGDILQEIINYFDCDIRIVQSEAIKGEDSQKENQFWNV